MDRARASIPSVTSGPVALAVAAIALLAAMDGTMKAASLAIGAYSAMTWRSLAGVAAAAPLWWLGGTPWPNRAVLRVHVMRGAVAAGMAVTFFHSLTLLPLAEAIAISFFAPLLALYLAAWMLDETVAPRAVAASVAGLGGVLVIVWPDIAGHAGQSAGRLEGIGAVVLSAVLYAFNLVLARRQALIASPREVTFFQNAIVFALLIPFAPWWLAAPGGALPVIAAAAALSLAAGLMLAWAYARAEAQVLVPMEYSAFVWAALVGWIGFGEGLGACTCAGAAIIVAACLVAARKAPPEAAAV
ncbi:DMT family transporter [Parablastomonas sp. CN1-191]|uniref:DMT family transporter n=1 Tax=Parablastomonas sp. CN1-191 TaxID=3400908 RepID=UPI003BF7F896